ncbi:MAG: PilZ domain-containing protein [Treponemataceae bacterium]
MYDFLLQIQGSPIEARKDGSFLFVLLAFFVISAFIWAISFLYSIYRKNQKVIDADPARKTTKKDISLISKKVNLTSEEKSFFYKLCQSYQIKNIFVNMKNSSDMNKIFFKIYKDLKDEDEIALFFAIRNKLDKYFNSENILSGTKNLKIGQSMTFIYNDDRYFTKLLENTEEGLLAGVPKNNFGQNLNIPVLEKISVIFSSKSNSIGYKVSTRIIRYQTRIEKEILVAHSNKIEVLHKRNQGRFMLNSKCEFHAVKLEKKSKTKGTSTAYEVMDKSHSGKIVDICSNGCSLLTDLPIKKDQYIQLKFYLEKDFLSEVIGAIVNTEFDKYTKMYILHINFVNISTGIKNRINALVAEYKNDTENN